MLVNPSFLIELERIKAGVTECVMPLHDFVFLSEYRGLVQTNPKLAKKLAESDLKKTEEYKVVKKLDLEVVVAPTLSGRVVPFQISPDLIVYVCRSDRKDFVEKKAEKMLKLEWRGLRRKTLKDWLKIFEIEGRMLGYPECCVEKFVKMKEKSFYGESVPPETDVVMRCLEHDFFDVLRFFKEPSEIPEQYFAFFTSNFYPCDVNCQKAISIGVAVREHLDEKLRRIYERKLVLNVLNLLVSAYSTYLFVRDRGAKTEFGRMVKDFFESLSSEDLKIISDLARRFSSERVKFENEYLLRFY